MDMYEFPTCCQQEKFDLIYDRASLVAINLDDREKYAALMTSCLKEDGEYYVIGTMLGCRITNLQQQFPSDCACIKAKSRGTFFKKNLSTRFSLLYKKNRMEKCFQIEFKVHVTFCLVRY